MVRVIRVQQQNVMTCLAACVTMALNAFEIEPESQLIIHASLIDRERHIPSELLAAALLRSKGLSVTLMRNLTIDHLRDACRAGLALCVVAHPLETQGRTHVVVVTQVDDDKVHVINPLSERAEDLAGDVPLDTFRLWWSRDSPSQVHRPNNAILVSRPA